jgi:hypothetical protein
MRKLAFHDVDKDNMAARRKMTFGLQRRKNMHDASIVAMQYIRPEEYCAQYMLWARWQAGVIDWLIDWCVCMSAQRQLEKIEVVGSEQQGRSRRRRVALARAAPLLVGRGRRSWRRWRRERAVAACMHGAQRLMGSEDGEQWSLASHGMSVQIKEGS